MTSTNEPFQENRLDYEVVKNFENLRISSTAPSQPLINTCSNDFSSAAPNDPLVSTKQSMVTMQVFVVVICSYFLFNFSTRSQSPGIESANKSTSPPVVEQSNIPNDPHGRSVIQEPLSTCSRQAAMAENSDQFRHRRSQPEDFDLPMEDLSNSFATTIKIVPELSDLAASMYL
ncbi:hypothetical protein M3Y98_00539600 [Aphelenchoides besseyi]|nr:hypothetical protein M3Y98_00539600 [Aphelenchoides besseyi]KAI6208122.1 hypothetical protein M3Y96_00081400 [Aphelenchoides besseyi]